MTKQHRTKKLLQAAKPTGLAAPSVCGRAVALAILIFLLSTGFTTSAYADGAQRTRADAVQIAKSRSGNGRVLSVKKKVNKNGDSVYAVKIIVNGRVKVYAIPEFAN